MAPPTPAKILLIDDEPSLVRGLTRLLHRDGYSVDTAPNGQHALAQLQTQRYDLILCDLHMPVLDGPAFYLTFRTLYRTFEAILEEPPAETGGGAIYRLFHTSQPIVATSFSP
jgi:CheY-like chemotaxis protein